MHADEDLRYQASTNETQIHLEAQHPIREFRAEKHSKVTKPRENRRSVRSPSRHAGVPLWASGRGARARALLKLHIANVSYFKAANDRLPASHRLSSHREAEHA